MENNKRHCGIIEPREGRPSHILLDQYVCSLLLHEPERRSTYKRKDSKQRGADAEQVKQNYNTGTGRNNRGGLKDRE